MAQAAAEAREAALWRRAASDAARLADADRAREAGDLVLASRAYVRLARSRPANDSTTAAKERLTQLAEEAQKKLAEIDAGLTREAGSLSSGEIFAEGRQRSENPRVAKWEEKVTAAFQEYDGLVDEYHEVPAAATRVKSHVAKQRRRAEYAMVLNEPEAKTLWEAAQEHEAEDHACCAYWVYRQAARLVPAPSARLAEKRLAEIGEDPELVAAAKACRELQKCHEIYNRAQRIVKMDPQRAKELYTQIVQRAPSDSEIYRAAQRQLQPVE